MKKFFNLLGNLSARGTRRFKIFVVYFLILPSIILPQIGWAATAGTDYTDTRTTSMADTFAASPAFRAEVYTNDGAEEDGVQSSCFQRLSARASRWWYGTSQTPFTAAPAPSLTGAELPSISGAGAMPSATASESKKGPTHTTWRPMTEEDTKTQPLVIVMDGIQKKLSANTVEEGRTSFAPKSQREMFINPLRGAAREARTSKKKVTPNQAILSDDNPLSASVVGSHAPRIPSGAGLQTPARAAAGDEDDGSSTSADSPGSESPPSSIGRPDDESKGGNIEIMVNPLHLDDEDGKDKGSPTRKLTPGLQKVSAYIEELFAQKATTLQKWRNVVTGIVVGGLGISLWGVVQYFSDNLGSVPNSDISQYFQNEGFDKAVNLRLAGIADLTLLVPYFAYRMKLIVDYAFGQAAIAPIATQHPSWSLRAKLGTVYFLTLLAAALQGVGPANDTYQSNAPFTNRQDVARIAPAPFGIFTALNFLMVLLPPVEEKIIARFINQASGPEVTTKRTKVLNGINQMMHKIYTMEASSLRTLWAKLQAPSRSGIDKLKVILHSVDPSTAVPAQSVVANRLRSALTALKSKRSITTATAIPDKGALSEASAITKATPAKSLMSFAALVKSLPKDESNALSTFVPAPAVGTKITIAAAPKPSPKPTFKAILKRAGTGLFWLSAIAVSVGSAYLAATKGHRGILDLDRRVQTGQADLTFFEQTVHQKGLLLEETALATIPNLFSSSMAGWDVYNGRSDYTGDFSTNNWVPYTNTSIRGTDAYSYCLSRATYKYNSNTMVYSMNFAPDCPMAPPIPGGSAFEITFDPHTDLLYNSDNANGLYGYIQSLYADIPYSFDPLPNHVLPQSRYFYELYVGQLAPQLLHPSNSTYTPTEDMERFSWAMGGFAGSIAFGIGVLSFKNFFQYIHDSFAKNPIVPMAGKNNRLFNAIEMSLIAAPQALFYSAQNVFLVWGALNGEEETLKILAAVAATTTALTVWFRTFDEAYVAMAGWLQQGWRNVQGKYNKYRGIGNGRPPLPVNVIKERAVRKLMTLREAVRKMDPKMLEEMFKEIYPLEAT